MADPTDLHLARLRRENTNTTVTPADLLRLCAEDIERENLSGTKMLIILYDDERQSVASSWRCGLTVIEEIGLLHTAGLRSMLVPVPGDR